MEIGELNSGISPRTGNAWQSQTFVIETLERFPIRIQFTLFGQDRIEKARLRIGEVVDVSGYCESHKVGDRWFTECRCTDIAQNGISRLLQKEIEYN